MAAHVHCANSVSMGDEQRKKMMMQNNEGDE